MVEMIGIIYAGLALLHLTVCVLGAATDLRTSGLARGKELTQFHKMLADDKLSRVKWAPLWPVLVARELVALLKWRSAR